MSRYNGSARRKQRDLKLAGRAGPYVKLEEGSKPRGLHWASQLFLPLLEDYFSHVEVKWNLVKHYLTTPGQIVLLGQPTSASHPFNHHLTSPGQMILHGKENTGAPSTCRITTGLTVLNGGLVDWHLATQSSPASARLGHTTPTRPSSHPWPTGESSSSSTTSRGVQSRVCFVSWQSRLVVKVKEGSERNVRENPTGFDLSFRINQVLKITFYC